MHIPGFCVGSGTLAQAFCVDGKEFHLLSCGFSPLVVNLDCQLG